jgi:site-specific recombinase
MLKLAFAVFASAIVLMAVAALVVFTVVPVANQATTFAIIAGLLVFGSGLSAGLLRRRRERLAILRRRNTEAE